MIICCPDCGMAARPGDGSVDLKLLLHAHEVDGLVTCSRHGPAQRVVLVNGPRQPVALCRACWIGVYAAAYAFIQAAMPALQDHNGHAAHDFPPCWCGAPAVGVAFDPTAGRWQPSTCRTGHDMRGGKA